MSASQSNERVIPWVVWEGQRHLVYFESVMGMLVIFELACWVCVAEVNEKSEDSVVASQCPQNSSDEYQFTVSTNQRSSRTLPPPLLISLLASLLDCLIVFRACPQKVTIPSPPTVLCSSSSCFPPWRTILLLLLLLPPSLVKRLPATLCSCTTTCERLPLLPLSHNDQSTRIVLLHDPWAGKKFATLLMKHWPVSMALTNLLWTMTCGVLRLRFQHQNTKIGCSNKIPLDHTHTHTRFGFAPNQLEWNWKNESIARTQSLHWPFFGILKV